MPRVKRWFHVNQDINEDPEFEVLCKTCGLSGVRFFLKIMAMLDKTDNKISLHGGFSPLLLSRSCGSKPKMMLTSYQLLIDMKWVSVGVDVNNNQFIYARNYLKYRGNKVHENESSSRLHAPLLSFPSLPLPSSLDKSKEEKKKDPPLPPKGKKCVWPDDFTLNGTMAAYAARHGITDPEDEFQHFHDNALAKGYKYLNWEMAWQNWCRSPYQQKNKDTTEYA